MKLSELLLGIELGRLTGPTDIDIRSVCYDSRKAVPGSLFFALEGEKLDGAIFVDDAVRRGAIAVASTRERPQSLSNTVSWVELRSGAGRRALA